MENIPFIQIRALSNYIGERDKTKWKLHEAVANLNLELQRLIKNYSTK
jgi:futalosine hydrolase